MPCLPVVRGKHVVAEVAARPAQHGVRVVAVVAGVVALDEQVIALHPVVMPGAGRDRPLPGEVQLARADPGGLPGRQFRGQPAGVQRDELAEQGKDPATFPIGKRVYLIVDDDPDKARERVLAGLHRIYGEMPGIEDVPVSGTPDEVTAGLRDVIDAGAEMILLNPVGRDLAEDREQMERLAAEVVPQLS